MDASMSIANLTTSSSLSVKRPESASSASGPNCRNISIPMLRSATSSSLRSGAIASATCRPPMDVSAFRADSLTPGCSSLRSLTSSCMKSSACASPMASQASLLTYGSSSPSLSRIFDWSIMRTLTSFIGYVPGFFNFIFHAICDEMIRQSDNVPTPMHFFNLPLSLCIVWLWSWQTLDSVMSRTLPISFNVSSS